MAKSVSKPIATSEPSKLKKKTTVKIKSDPKKTAKKPKEKEEVIPQAPVKPAEKYRLHESDEKQEFTIEQKLIALHNLQQIDSQVDKIRIIRGELPLEVQDLEDEIAGLETRVDNYMQETVTLEKSVLEKKNAIKESNALIKRYEEQQMNVRNNREYDSLSK